MSDYVEGLYDQLIDQLFVASADDLTSRRLQAEIESVEPAEMANRIGEIVGRWAADALATVSTGDRNAAATRLTTQLPAEIDHLHPDAVDPGQQPTDPIQRLTAIEPLDPTDDPIPIKRPITPLRDTVLMTNARDPVSYTHLGTGCLAEDARAGLAQEQFGLLEYVARLAGAPHFDRRALPEE